MLTDMYNEGKAPWEVWKSRDAESPTQRGVSGDARSQLCRTRDGWPSRSCASGRTATTSRSDVAARFFGCSRRFLAPTCAGSCLGQRAARATEAIASANKFLANAHTKEIVVKEFRDGFFPHSGAEIKEFFEELKRGLRSGSHPDALSQRPASGSPRRVRIDLEHVPRPSDSRVRDRQVRRRPRNPEFLRATERCDLPAEGART